LLVNSSPEVWSKSARGKKPYSIRCCGKFLLASLREERDIKDFFPLAVKASPQNSL
jgi:hypothetical protein